MCGHWPSAGPSDVVRGSWLAPRSTVRLCGWRGPVLAGGPSACWNLGLCAVLSCCFRWPVVGRHSFMAKSCGDDMTKLNLLRGSSADSCLLWGNRESPLGGAFIGNGQCCLDWSAVMHSSSLGLSLPIPASVAKTVILSPDSVQPFRRRHLCGEACPTSKDIERQWCRLLARITEEDPGRASSLLRFFP
jgi:hypothetical protein